MSITARLSHIRRHNRIIIRRSRLNHLLNRVTTTTRHSTSVNLLRHNHIVSNIAHRNSGVTTALGRLSRPRFIFKQRPTRSIRIKRVDRRHLVIRTLRLQTNSSAKTRTRINNGNANNSHIVPNSRTRVSAHTRHSKGNLLNKQPRQVSSPSRHSRIRINSHDRKIKRGLLTNTLKMRTSPRDRSPRPVTNRILVHLYGHH